jgi:hypothetical protein
MLYINLKNYSYITSIVFLRTLLIKFIYINCLGFLIFSFSDIFFAKFVYYRLIFYYTVFTAVYSYSYLVRKLKIFIVFLISFFFVIFLVKIPFIQFYYFNFLVERSNSLLFSFNVSCLISN